MNDALVFGILLISVIVTAVRGPGWALAVVYFPALILFSEVPDITRIPHIPLNANYAAMYGILLGLPFQGGRLRLRWNIVDSLVVAMWLSYVVTMSNSDIIEATINYTRNEALNWVVPYFLARLIFGDVEVRRLTLWTLVAIIAFTSLCTLVELRLIPYFYLHTLNSLGFHIYIQPMAYNRYHLFRVACTVMHPIYWGNVNLLLLGFVLVLARTTGYRIKQNSLLILAVIGTLGSLVASLSFTPYAGLIAATIIFLGLWYVPFIRRHIFLLTTAGFLIAISVTLIIAASALPERGTDDNTLWGSFVIRCKIIQNSGRTAATAGWFGFGRYIPEDLDLSSVDNSYMHWTLQRGFVFVSLFILLGIAYAGRAQKALRQSTTSAQRVPICVATAVLFGVMVAMYTVWSGSIYWFLWAVFLGLTNTLIDMILAGPTRPLPAMPQPMRGRPLLSRPMPNLNRPGPYVPGAEEARNAPDAADPVVIRTPPPQPAGG